MPENPFINGSQKYKTFEKLSDLKWHCANCELPGSQSAATIRDFRRMGYGVETAAIKGGIQGAMDCAKCGRKTTHYRLMNVKPIYSPKTRTALPSWLVDRILRLYDYREAITGRKRHPKDLNVDHKVPNIRWRESEEEFSPGISDGEILERFQLITTDDNLWKSRACEECVKTGMRQPFLGINFFYVGSERYEEGLGCEGCGWHDPKRWRGELNRFLRQVGRS